MRFNTQTEGRKVTRRNPNEDQRAAGDRLPNMKQQLDELRTLAIKLYEAGQKQKRKQPKDIWGSDRNRTWSDLPSEGVDVWDAIALCAYEQLKP